MVLDCLCFCCLMIGLGFVVGLVRCRFLEVSFLVYCVLVLDVSDVFIEVFDF